MDAHTPQSPAPAEVTFVSFHLSGAGNAANIDDWVDAWHDSDSEKTLAEFLGFTGEEYSRWASDPGSLADILAARRQLAAVCPPAALTVTGQTARPCGCPTGECHDAGATGCYFGPSPDAITSEGPLR